MPRGSSQGLGSLQTQVSQEQLDEQRRQGQAPVSAPSIAEEASKLQSSELPDQIPEAQIPDNPAEAASQVAEAQSFFDLAFGENPEPEPTQAAMNAEQKGNAVQPSTEPANAVAQQPQEVAAQQAEPIAENTQDQVPDFLAQGPGIVEDGVENNELNEPEVSPTDEYIADTTEDTGYENITPPTPPRVTSFQDQLNEMYRQQEERIASQSARQQIDLLSMPEPTEYDGLTLTEDVDKDDNYSEWFEDVDHRAFPRGRELIEEQAKNQYSRIGEGITASAKVIKDSSISTAEIGVSSGLLVKMARQPKSGFVQWLKEQPQLADYANQIALIETNEMAEEDQEAFFVNVLNQFEFWIPCIKYPASELESVHARVLKVYSAGSEAGIRAHPQSTPIFNADHDGDTITISFYKGYMDRMPTGLDFWIGLDGKPKIDPDYFTFCQWGTLEQCTEELMKSVFPKVWPDVEIKETTARVLAGQCLKIASTRTEIMENGRVKVHKAKDDPAKLAEFLETIIDVAVMLPGDSRMNAFKLFDALYDMNSKVNQMRIAIKARAAAESRYKPPKRRKNGNPENKVFSECLAGEKPVNTATFMAKAHEAGMHKVDKGNQYFRSVADAGKPYKQGGGPYFAYKPDNMTPEETAAWEKSRDDFYKSYSKMAKTEVALFMEGTAEMGDETLYAGNIVREQVATGAGMPRGIRSNQECEKWVERFADYDNEWRMIESHASTELRTDWNIQEAQNKGMQWAGRKKDEKYYSNLVTHILDIYPDITLVSFIGEEAFNRPEMQMFIPYKNYKLIDFAYTNRLPLGGNIGSISIEKTYDMAKAKTDSAREKLRKNDKNKSSGWMLADLLMAIADKRTSFASTYNGDLKHNAKTAIDAIRELNNIRKELQKPENVSMHDYKRDIELLTDVLYMFGPEMFLDMGMAYYDKFLDSKLGRRLLECKSEDEFLGVREAAITEWRVSKIRKLIEQSKKTNDEKTQKRILDDINGEIDELRASSMLWKYVITDMRFGGALWRSAVVNGGGQWQYNTININGEPTQVPVRRQGYVDAKNFWADLSKDELPGESEAKKYNSVLEVMLDAEIGYEQKNSILSDFVKYASGYMYVKNYEIPSMLEQQPFGLHSHNRFMADTGHKQMLDNLKAASDKFNNYTRRNAKECRENIERAARVYSGIPGALTNYLKILRDMPGAHISISPDALADALVNVMDKTYDATEKSSNQAAINNEYSSLSLIQNGRIISDTEAMDDMALGKIAYDRFIRSPHEILWLLTDENYTIEVYGPEGSVTLTRNRILDLEENATPEQVEKRMWEWLSDHPRVAMGFRAQTTAATDDGNAYLSANCNLKESMDMYLKRRQAPERMVMNMFANQPHFMAICGIVRDVTGYSYRIQRGRMKKSIQEVSRFIAHMAQWDQADIDAFELPDSVKARVPKQVDANSEEWADFITDIEDSLRKYATKAKQAEIMAPKGEIKQPDELFANIDKFATYAMYFDTVQTLSSAKTENNLNVNGGEGKRNWAVKYYSTWIPHDCGSGEPIQLTVEEFANNWKQYKNVRTQHKDPKGNYFYVQRKTKERIISAAKREAAEQNLDTPVILVEDICACTSAMPCERHSVCDSSSGQKNLKNMVGSMSRFLEIIRSKAAEEFNLKVKKWGDDGKDLIVKFLVRFTDKGADRRIVWYKTLVKINKFWNKGDIRSARELLASYLERYQEEFGYEEEFTHNDALNRAQGMMRKRSDGSLRIISIGEISMVLKHKLPANPDVFGMNADEVRAFAEKCIQEYVDSDSASPELWFHSMDVASYGGYRAVSNEFANQPERRLRTAISMAQRRGELDENYKLTKTAETLSQKDLDALSVKNSKLIKNEWLRDELQRMVFPKDKYKNGERKHQDKGDRSHLYDITGVLHADYDGKWEDHPAARIPGAKSAWVVDGIPEDPKILEDMCEEAELLGITVFFPNEAALRYNIDAVRVSEHVFAIPYFDIAMNGVSRPGIGSFNVGECYTPPGTLSNTVEDTTTEFDPGDSATVVTDNALDNFHPEKDGQQQIPLSQICPNYIEKCKEALGVTDSDHIFDIHVRCPSSEEIEACISKNTFPANIDLGVRTKDEEREWERLSKDTKTYLRRFNKIKGTQPNGIIQEADHGDIIGWVICEVPGFEECWAPIRIYDRDMHKGAPATFHAISVSSRPSQQKLIIDWVHNPKRSDFKNYVAKYFLGDAASTKTMTILEGCGYRYLADGDSIHAYIPTETIGTRMILTKRVNTLTSMIFTARSNYHGYNLADIKGFFPGNPELRKYMQKNEIPMEIWTKWAKQCRESGKPMSFWPDKNPKEKARMDRFLSDIMVNLIDCGVSPSTFFASHYDGIPTYKNTDWRCIVESNPRWQNCLMCMFNELEPGFCPRSLDDEPSNDHLFEPCLDRGDNWGVMQRMVEHKDPNGDMFQIRETVYTVPSFFDSHYSGYTKANPNAKGRSISADDVLGYRQGRLPLYKDLRYSMLYNTPEIPIDFEMPMQAEIIGEEYDEYPEQEE